MERRSVRKEFLIEGRRYDKRQTPVYALRSAASSGVPLWSRRRIYKEVNRRPSTSQLTTESSHCWPCLTVFQPILASLAIPKEITWTT